MCVRAPTCANGSHINTFCVIIVEAPLTKCHTFSERRLDFFHLLLRPKRRRRLLLVIVYYVIRDAILNQTILFIFYSIWCNG